MKKYNGFIRRVKFLRSPRFIFTIVLSFIFFYSGIKFQQSKNVELKPTVVESTKEIFPECISGLCPNYFQIDAVPTNNSPETAIVIPLAMTQGFGKLVIIGEGGKKLFDSDGLPGIWVEPTGDGNGFIMKYTSAVDEDFNRINYEARFVWKEGGFIKSEEGILEDTQTTRSQAEDLVKSLPEVKKQLKNSKTEWIVEAIDKHDVWTVQVAQVVIRCLENDEACGNLATFNWYDVDKKSGKIICSMFIYDEDGEYTDKLGECK